MPIPELNCIELQTFNGQFVECFEVKLKSDQAEPEVIIFKSKTYKFTGFTNKRTTAIYRECSHRVLAI